MIEGGLAMANEQMQTISNHQILSQAPLSIRKQYFLDLYTSMAMEALNKR